MTCTEFRPDHNGECLNCDEWADAHDGVTMKDFTVEQSAGVIQDVAILNAAYRASLIDAEHLRRENERYRAELQRMQQALQRILHLVDPSEPDAA